MAIDARSSIAESRVQMAPSSTRAWLPKARVVVVTISMARGMEATCVWVYIGVGFDMCSVLDMLGVIYVLICDNMYVCMHER